MLGLLRKTLPLMVAASTSMVGVFIPGLASADTHLSNFTAHYKATIKGFKTSAVRQLKDLDDGRKEISFKADSWIASVEERSRFHFKNNRLVPEEYRFRLKALGSTSKRDTLFDHDGKTITHKEKGKTWQPEYSPRALDELSYQLQLQYDLKINSGDLSYQLIKKNRLEERQFAIIGEERLDTPMGTMRTLKVALQNDNNKKRSYFWVAPDWDCLLVRFEQHKDGKKDFVIDLVHATVDNVQVAGL